MIVAGMYSFKGGEEVVKQLYPSELREIFEVITTVDCSLYKTKISKEKTTQGKLQYDPSALNVAYKRAFEARNWFAHRVYCDYPTTYYTSGYQSSGKWRGAFREMDFVKNRLGVEVQFGKYAFMVYNVCAKMTIFRNLDVIDAGVEIVPVKDLADQMSTGVSYFEQFVWDLETRGVSNIDIPVLILGVSF